MECTLNKRHMFTNPDELVYENLFVMVFVGDLNGQFA